MTNGKPDNHLELSDVQHVERVSVGGLNPNQPVTEEQRQAQIELLNRFLNELPRGQIIGREVSTAVYQIGEHQITMQQIIYHVGFKRQPYWWEQEKARQTQPPPAPPTDNLRLIEGIGPKIEKLLQDVDIRTYGQLARTSADNLQKILRAGGSAFNTVNPKTWPHQAALANFALWEELSRYQEILRGGKDPTDPVVGRENI